MPIIRDNNVTKERLRNYAESNLSFLNDIETDSNHVYNHSNDITKSDHGCNHSTFFIKKNRIISKDFKRSIPQRSMSLPININNVKKGEDGRRNRIHTISTNAKIVRTHQESRRENQLTMVDIAAPKISLILLSSEHRQRNMKKKWTSDRSLKYKSFHFEGGRRKVLQGAAIDVFGRSSHRF